MSRFIARILTAATIAVAVVVVVARPATAGVTAATLSGNPPNTATCPVTLTFSGMITGTQGTTLQYSFNRYINGVQQVQNAGAVTIPFSGSIAVSDSFVVNGSSTGTNFDQVWVHDIAGGQGDVYSPRASFSVTCGGTSTPSPGGTPLLHGGLNTYSAGHSATALLSAVPIPTNLKSTTDPHECGRHGGLAGVFCIQAVPDKYLILVWDWSPNDKWPAIDGYHIYDVTGGGKTRVQDQTNPQATVEFFKPGSYANKCYAVSAYKGATESVLSPSFCTANAQVGVKTSSLKLIDWETRDHMYCHATICGVRPCNGIVCMGWFHKTTDGHENYYRRAYLLFDQSQVIGRNIYGAKLQIVTSGDPMCLGGLGTADQPWAGTPYTTLVPATIDTSIPRMVSNSNTTFDVTAFVRDWSRGGPNNGFVLVGTNENSGAEDDGNCWVDVTKIALSIQYY